MERLLWPRPPTPKPDLSGTYTAKNGGECVAKFWLNPHGELQGSFMAEGEELALSGRFLEHRGKAIGFLLDPVSKNPIGMFRATLSENGLVLEIDVPDFVELLENCDLEPIHLERLSHL